MSNFSQKFTLLDIFNNKNLKDKLPLINYKETIKEDGKVSVRTNAKTVNRMVFDTATSAARPFYKPILTTRTGDSMEIGGNLVGDQDACVDAVYNRLMAQRVVLIWTANNKDMIRDALKESEKARRRMGIGCKLWLRAKSMKEIEGMSRPQLQELLRDVMDNIFYGDDYPATQKKWNVENLPSVDRHSYEENKKIWKNKVGLV